MLEQRGDWTDVGGERHRRSKTSESSEGGSSCFARTELAFGVSGEASGCAVGLESNPIGAWWDLNGIGKGQGLIG